MQQRRLPCDAPGKECGRWGNWLDPVNQGRGLSGFNILLQHPNRCLHVATCSDPEMRLPLGHRSLAAIHNRSQHGRATGDAVHGWGGAGIHAGCFSRSMGWAPSAMYAMTQSLLRPDQ